MKVFIDIFLVLIFILLSSCSSSSAPTLDPGRCNLTTDCPQGHECVNTRCQDLYYPKNLIRQK